MKKLTLLFLSTLLLSFTGNASAQLPKGTERLAAKDAKTAQKTLLKDPKTGQQPKTFTKTLVKEVSLQYLLYLPKQYDPKKPLPLILFLHGAGERGDDLQKLKKHGPPKIVQQKDDFHFIVVSPQCPSSSWWTAETEALNALLDDIVAHYAVDTDRIYLTGLSMGGFGSWSLASAHPERFAAVAPICGGGDHRTVARKLALMPLWVFHGAKDPVVPIQEAQEIVDALKKRGSDVKFTIYPDAQHDSWTKTYDNPQLYAWFLKHRLSDRKKPEPKKK